MFGYTSNALSKWNISCHLEVNELDIIEIYQFKIKVILMKDLKIHFENNEYWNQMRNSLLSLMLNDMTRTILSYQENLMKLEDRSKNYKDEIGINVSSDDLRSPLNQNLEQIDLDVLDKAKNDGSKKGFNLNEEIKNG